MEKVAVLNFHSSKTWCVSEPNPKSITTMGRGKLKIKVGKPKTLEIQFRKSKLGEPNNAFSSCPPTPPSPPPLAASSPPPVASPPPPWAELPGDITANILQRLGVVEILESAQRVCTTWRRVSQDPTIWRVIGMENLGGLEIEKIPIVYRLAVDRSQGQLIDLSLDYCADDELLTYIVQRSSKLRRLTLNYCLNITGEGLVEAVKRLPNLEELHLILMTSVSAANVEVIGISRPMLKSFTFNERGWKCPIFHDFLEGPNNVYALAIAKTMPNLLHLRVFANSMPDEGLQAILDGCPHLESLDIRQCFYLDLRGGLGKRLSKQIKNLKLPSDSISDIAWLGDNSGYYPNYESDEFFDDYGYADDFGYYDYDEYGDSCSLFGDDDPWDIFGRDYL